MWDQLIEVSINPLRGLEEGNMGGQLFWLGGHFVEAEVGGGPHLLKLLHSLVNFAFQKRYKLYHKNQ
jgi:hypothetical protein